METLFKRRLRSTPPDRVFFRQYKLDAEQYHRDRQNLCRLTQ